ncbi:hypothetical protein MGALJ_39580 [Mycobacterium gallinarum]|uniref:Uncharacterized protein n=1 Tax=Mycobacterium gallinarum TaxID=39689 RepID=A0A9W4BL56_9MYCO|nr:hypothetical protein MGALJ_39580 [Mycobacterium gallinarum]
MTNRAFKARWRTASAGDKKQERATPEGNTTPHRDMSERERVIQKLKEKKR